MDLQRQVTTSRDSSGKLLATVETYYNKFVHSLGGKYLNNSFSKDKMCICPFHDDNDASLGLINDKIDKDVRIFHCFGCGASGDIVQFHRRFIYKTEKRSISVETASREVATIFGIVINEQAIEDHLNSLLFEREIQVEKDLGGYNFRSHSANLMKLRMVQEEMPLDEFSENLDIIINKWKLAINEHAGKLN